MPSAAPSGAAVGRGRAGARGADLDWDPPLCGPAREGLSGGARVPPEQKDDPGVRRAAHAHAAHLEAAEEGERGLSRRGGGARLAPVRAAAGRGRAGLDGGAGYRHAGVTESIL